MKTPGPVAGRDTLLAVVLMLLAPLAAVVATTAPAHAGPAFQQPAVGECRALTMDEFNRASNNEAPIDCSQPHTSRVIDTVRLPRGVSWGASIQKLTRIATRICNPAWTEALGGTFRSRAMTAYSAGWFMPTKAQRERGARWIRCDLVLRAGSALANCPPTACRRWVRSPTRNASRPASRGALSSRRSVPAGTRGGPPGRSSSTRRPTRPSGSSGGLRFAGAPPGSPPTPSRGASAARSVAAGRPRRGAATPARATDSAPLGQPRQASSPDRSAYSRTQACMAIAAAALALIERVEPNWAMENVPSHDFRASSDSPGPS